MDDRFRFRAWNRVTKKMVDLEAITPLALCFQMKDGEGGVFLPFTDNMILLQCTGLKDKNGVLIYEGDVVRQFEGKPWQGDFVIRWNQARCGFYLYLNGKPHLELSDYREGLIVIGNTYENPELIGGE